jgi:hemerythrin superfamily protein
MANTQGAPGDAVEILIEDHKRVLKLFKQFENTDRDDEESLQDVVESAIAELQVHSMLEEELFYPAVRAQLDDDEGEDLLNEAEVEHESVDELIAKLQELDAGDAMYAAYFTVLAEYVKHHVKEEEKELFPRVKKLPDLDLEQLGRDIETRREALLAEAADDEDADEAAAGRAARGTSAPEEELEDEEEQVEQPPTKH